MTRRLLKYLLYLSCIAVMSSSIVACHHNANKDQKKGMQTITVAPKASQNVLHYAGTIQPLSQMPVTSPEDGVINKMAFQYGDILKKGKLLYVVRSPKQHEAFETALTDFLKAKQTVSASRAKNQSTEQLYKEGIVSKDDMKEAKEKNYSDELAFYQAKSKFDQELKLHQIKDLPKLTIADVATIKKILRSYREKTERVTLYAQSSGIALLPKDDKKSQVLVGKSVKAGDVLLYIGDITGLSIEIEVNEIDINQLKEGQKVMVTSDVLPNIVLHGYIDHINTQALSGSGGSPIFAIKVVVPTITAKQRKLIHIGMSAEVSITLKHKPQILIPVSAVVRKSGQTVVKILKNGKIKTVAVTTGPTTKESVVITSGLTSGDQVVTSN